VGFPIRKSADQRLFAPPHGLSQRTTSFIASQRQGIHRIPLRHLIALIINTHPSAEVIRLAPYEGVIERPFASNISENIAVKQMLTTGSSSSRTCVKSNFLQETQAIKPPFDKRSDMFPLHDDRQHAKRSRACVFDLPKDFSMSRKARRRQSDRLVEPDGIEPTTSCLQSTRSPN
jgi:hypothetical protein